MRKTHKEIINLTEIAIGEFEFLVLAIRFRILKYSAPYVPAGYFNVTF